MNFRKAKRNGPGLPGIDLKREPGVGIGFGIAVEFAVERSDQARNVAFGMPSALALLVVR